ncbi:MAG: HNH endonuclease [Verrucomicrobiota bacterium]|jgi:putative restriction endonuclease
MAKLNKTEMLTAVLKAIRASGWDAIVLDRRHPFHISMYRSEERVIFLCYIWNLTHGGYPRDPNELRIQITGVDRFTIESGSKTLVLGFSEAENMFAGFDVTKHPISMSGRSPSFQIRRETLLHAATTGFYPQTRHNNEMAIAFLPGFFATYVTELEALHGSAQHPQDILALVQIAETNTTNIQDIPAGPRRTVVQQIQKKVRNTRFRDNVLASYGYRCAASDIQLDLLDAAHIIPVEHVRGTDETKNGLCLSPIHHRAFDHGLLGIKRNYSIVFHDENFTKLRAIGWDGGEKAFRGSCRDAINLPSRREFYPDPDYLEFGQVLRGWNPRQIS